MGERTPRTSFAPPPGEAGSFRYRDKGYHQVFALSGHDVANGGVLIETLSPIERSRTLTFEMRTAEGRSLEGVCVVVRTRDAERSGPDRPPGMIVRFIHFDDPDAARRILGALIAREDVPRRGRHVLERMLEHCNLRPSATIEDEESAGDVPTPAPSSPETVKGVQVDVLPAKRQPSRRTIAVASGAVALAVLTVAALMASGYPGRSEPEVTQAGPPGAGRPVELPKPDPPPPPRGTTAPRTSSSAPSLPSPSELENGPDGPTPPRWSGPPSGGPAPAGTGEDPYDAPGRPPSPTSPANTPGGEPYD